MITHTYPSSIHHTIIHATCGHNCLYREYLKACVHTPHPSRRLSAPSPRQRRRCEERGRGEFVYFFHEYCPRNRETQSLYKPVAPPVGRPRLPAPSASEGSGHISLLFQRGHGGIERENKEMPVGGGSVGSDTGTSKLGCYHYSFNRCTLVRWFAPGHPLSLSAGSGIAPPGRDPLCSSMRTR